MHHQAADRVDFLVAEVAAEEVVEVIDVGQRLNGENTLVDAADLFLWAPVRRRTRLGA